MFSSPISTCSNSTIAIDIPYEPCGLQANEGLDFYLDDLQGTYRWIVNNKRMLHQIQYSLEQAHLRAGDTHSLRAFFREQLGDITSFLMLVLEFDPLSQYILKARNYAVWELKIASRPQVRIYVLVRRASGWDFHLEGPVGKKLVLLEKILVKLHWVG